MLGQSPCNYQFKCHLGYIDDINNGILYMETEVSISSVRNSTENLVLAVESAELIQNPKSCFMVNEILHEYQNCFCVSQR